jgi:hypothetical protein
MYIQVSLPLAKFSQLIGQEGLLSVPNVPCMSNERYG